MNRTNVMRMALTVAAASTTFGPVGWDLGEQPSKREDRSPPPIVRGGDVSMEQLVAMRRKNARRRR